MPSSRLLVIATVLGLVASVLVIISITSGWWVSILDKELGPADQLSTPISTVLSARTPTHELSQTPTSTPTTTPVAAATPTPSLRISELSCEDIYKMGNEAARITNHTSRSRSLSTSAETALAHGCYDLSITIAKNIPQHLPRSYTLKFIALCTASLDLFGHAYKAADSIPTSMIRDLAKGEVVQIHSKRMRVPDDLGCPELVMRSP